LQSLNQIEIYPQNLAGKKGICRHIRLNLTTRILPIMTESTSSREIFGFKMLLPERVTNLLEFTSHHDRGLRGNPKMNRREFFSFAAAGAVAAPKAVHSEPVEVLSEQLEAAIRRELPSLTRVEVKYNPDDDRVPLIVVAYLI
jgi:hypothetical protein